MDNLEPITRNEMFLNGDDLEPITREEMILAGEDLEPITRHEWFLKKYRGGGGGGGYDLVNVPNLPADIASFNDGTDLPMASLKVAVTPYQDLSHGDPSPENICPIIGWDEAVVTVADDVDNPTVSHEYTIDLDGTRYICELDVINGVLKVVGVMKTFSNTDLWTVSGGNVYLAISGGGEGEIISDIFLNGNTSGKASYVSSNNRFYIWDAVSVYGVTTREECQAFFSGHQLVYELATPITVQLAPTPVKSLEGENNISANCGQITEVKYFKKA